MVCRVRLTGSLPNIEWSRRRIVLRYMVGTRGNGEVSTSLTVTTFCVRTVSHTPRNPGATPSFTRARWSRLLLRKVV